MKKLLIGLFALVVIGIGVYSFSDKIKETAGNVAEKQMRQFLTKYNNQFFKIRVLESYPLVEEATWMINDSNKNVINSILSLKIVGEERIQIPLHSEIIRGETAYADKQYGFGKIVTKADFSRVDGLPTWFHNDMLTSTLYVTLSGDVTKVLEVASIENAETFNFKGVEAIFETTMLNYSQIKMHMAFKGLSTQSIGVRYATQTLISPFQLDGNYTASTGEYSGQMTPIDYSVSVDEQPVFSFYSGESTITGFYQFDANFSVPLCKTKITFDTLTFKSPKIQDLVFSNVVMASEVSKSGEKTLDLLSELTVETDGEALKDLLPALPTQKKLSVDLQKIEWRFGIRQLRSDSFDHYIDLAKKIDSAKGDIKTIKKDSLALLESLQESDVSFEADLAIQAAEGNAKSSLKTIFSTRAQSLLPEELANQFESVIKTPQNTFSRFFDTKVLVVVDESLANAMDMSTMLAMGLGVEAIDGKLTIDAEMKNERLLINGTKF